MVGRGGEGGGAWGEARPGATRPVLRSTTAADTELREQLQGQPTAA